MASRKHAKWFAELERKAEWGLGIRKYVPVSDNPTSDNAKFVLPRCDNVNLEKDGFCQQCDMLHWRIVRRIFRCDASVPVYKKGMPRTEENIEKYVTVKRWDVTAPEKVLCGKLRKDAGCDTFGDTGSGMFSNDNVLDWNPVAVPFIPNVSDRNAQIILDVINEVRESVGEKPIEVE